jgi:PTS system cellobiose-specific IIC component
MNLAAIYVVIAMAIAMSRAFKQNTGSTIMVSMVAFFVITPIGNMFATKIAENPTSVIDISYLGSKGIFAAIIVAILASRLYYLLMDKKVTIKMPDAVPPFVSNMFAQIIPIGIVTIVFAIVQTLFSLTSFGNFHDFIYSILQAPLVGLSDNIVAVCILVFVAELLWFFGIHGSAVTSGVLAVMFSSQAYANAAAVAAGTAPQYIINSFFIDLFKGPRALALALLLIYFCKSKHMKSVGKVAIVPSLFTITEPMKFGIPMVLNPWLLLPMSLSAVVCELIAYGASVIGFLPVVSVNVGRTLPPIISGLVACGWQGAVIQLIQLVIVILMYIPFLRKVDRDALKKEAEPKEEQLKA